MWSIKIRDILSEVHYDGCIRHAIHSGLLTRKLASCFNIFVSDENETCNRGPLLSFGKNYCTQIIFCKGSATAYKKIVWFAPLQFTKAVCVLLGAKNRAVSFDFKWKNKTASKESLALCLVIVLSFEKEKISVFKVTCNHKCVAFFTTVGVQNRTALSNTAKWIHNTGCTQADVRGEQLGLLSMGLGWKNTALLAINSNIW